MRGGEILPPRLTLELRGAQSCALSLKYQLKLAQKWDQINSDLCSFVARERKETATIGEIITENSSLGKFAAGQIKKVCSKSTPDDVNRRLLGGKMILAVGYGQGWDSDIWWDSNWLGDAAKAGLQTTWLDVSGVACAIATEKSSRTWVHLSKRGETFQTLPPAVIKGEIRSVLGDPSTVDLALDSVEIFYLCRTLFALSKRSARTSLQIMGNCLSEDNDLHRHKRIILINPLKDDNPERETKTSISLSRKMILSNLRRGAGRRLRVEYDYHRYFGRLYTAMIIRAE